MERFIIYRVPGYHVGKHALEGMKKRVTAKARHRLANLSQMFKRGEKEKESGGGKGGSDL